MKFLFYCLIFFSSSFTLAQKKIIYTNKAPKPIGPYSQGVLAGKTLYVAGQIGITTGGEIHTDCIDNETTQALHNIHVILQAAKMDYKHVVKATIYLTDLKDFAKVNEIYGTCFKENPPARETVEVKALPKGAHVEIAVIAVGN
jgi:2-iminobutanoate/2-iminopropanoate deaminase